MNTVPIRVLMLMVLSVPLAFAADEASQGEVKEVAADVGAPPATQEDQENSMQELCASYADEEGVAAAVRGGYIQDCLDSMTDLSTNMQDGEPVGADPEDGVVNQEATHPEALIADELVDKPTPGVEQLVPEISATVE